MIVFLESPKLMRRLSGVLSGAVAIGLAQVDQVTLSLGSVPRSTGHSTNRWSGLVTTRLKSGYAIRSAQIEELPQLAAIEQAAAIRFQGTPDAFLADGEPLPIEFIQQRFHAGQVWVAVDRHNVVIGFAVTREVDRTLYLQEIDIAPNHGRRGLGKALVKTVQAWGKHSGYATRQKTLGRLLQLSQTS